MLEPSGARPSVTEDDIRKILAGERRLVLVAQPIVDLRRGVVVGYETLARFQLDAPAPPDAVFAAASRAGLGEELEAFVVERALALSADRPPNCFLAINVDPQHLTSDRVLSVIDVHGSLGGIIFELTEERRITDIAKVADTLVKLRRRGAFTAVDDAGAGYSGLQQILALRPQFLKVDRALVSSVHTDEAKRAMIQMLGELAGRLDAWILAEGVETEAELRTLAQLGVPLAQGYFLARPSPPFAALTPEVERSLAGLPKRALSTSLVENLVEPAPSCDAAAEWPVGVGVCVRLEGAGRPIGLRTLDEYGERIREGHELLRVKRASSMSSVALRVAARAERYRWDPIVCIDDLGNFDGLIPVHKLLWALANRETDVAPKSSRAYDAEAVSGVRH